MNDKNGGFCVAYQVKDAGDKGRGVFAGEAIPRGTVVWRHVPGQYTVYDEQAFMTAIEGMSRDEVVYELTHAFGLGDLPGCLIRIFDEGALINHADEANLATNLGAALAPSLDPSSARYLQDAIDALLGDRYALIATRDIKAGEEFTNDYSAEVDDPPFFEDLCERYGVTEDYLDDD